MASGIRFDVVDTPIGRREAKRDFKLRDEYLRQNPAASSDMMRRHQPLRPFVAWDGEGWTDDTGQHHFMLWGASTGDAISGASLGTRECLDLLLSVEVNNPYAYHIIFAGNYDVNMMLRDVDIETLVRLKTDGVAKWQGYRIEYRKTKWFRVSKGGISITLYDVFTFFSCSFVKALSEYIGEDNEDVQRIIAGKSRRAEFTPADLAEVTAYWRTELTYLVRLADRLRTLLARADIRITRWHGPGAVASYILRERAFKRVETPGAVNVASQFAYAGGRFEPYRIGKYVGPVYQYDIRSAYPYAISQLPSNRGVWEHISNPSEVRRYALYHVRLHARDNNLPHWYPNPLHWRARNGAIYFPNRTEGWYWGVEVRDINREIFDVEILEGWEQLDNGDRPFAWIADYYRQRAEWKVQGEPAQLALKLAMNSIYGKLAQQVGWSFNEDGSLRLPTYHQIEHAGFVTATTRSMLYPALLQAGSALVACETDSVTSTKPIQVDIGEGLGQWEEKEYEGLIYVQSGVYWALDDGEWKARSRGFGRGDIDPNNVVEWLSRIGDAAQAYEVEPLRVLQRRFKTIGTSIGKPSWRRWVEETRELHAGIHGGKREHVLGECYECPGALSEGLHTMSVGKGQDFRGESMRYPLEWKEGRTAMQDGIAEMMFDVEEWEL